MAPKKDKEEIKEGKLPIFLYSIIFLFILSGLSSLYLLYAKILLVLSGSAKIGVYISCILLILYLTMIANSVYFMLKLNKRAIKTSILTIALGIILLFWTNMLGYWLFLDLNSAMAIIKIQLPKFFLNLAINLIMISYLSKSKEVKKLFHKT
jgi:hypothetical protein